MLAVRTLGYRLNRAYYTKQPPYLAKNQMMKAILKATPAAESWVLGS